MWLDFRSFDFCLNLRTEPFQDQSQSMLSREQRAEREACREFNQNTKFHWNPPRVNTRPQFQAFARSPFGILGELSGNAKRDRTLMGKACYTVPIPIFHKNTHFGDGGLRWQRRVGEKYWSSDTLCKSGRGPISLKVGNFSRMAFRNNQIDYKKRLACIFFERFILCS